LINLSQRAENSYQVSQQAALSIFQPLDYYYSYAAGFRNFHLSPVLIQSLGSYSLANN
jgi:hypothetical protein